MTELHGEIDKSIYPQSQCEIFNTPFSLIIRINRFFFLSLETYLANMFNLTIRAYVVHYIQLLQKTHSFTTLSPGYS